MAAAPAPAEPAPSGTAIGLFGGTFNPIHNGHLTSAEAVRDAVPLDRVLLIPARLPPHKNAWELPAAAHRVAMVRAAIAGRERLEISEVEINREGPSYTVDTLTYFREQWGEDVALHFILGMDAFREITSWYQCEDIFALADVIVTTRPGSLPATPADVFPVAFAERLVYDGTRYRTPGGRTLEFMTIPEIPVSATEIRRRLHTGEVITGLVPPAVETYIQTHSLYH